MWENIAARQVGLITVSQLVAAGLSPSQRAVLVRSGSLVRVHPQVLRCATAPQTLTQRRLAAVLAVEHGALSHRSAAAVLGAGGCDAAPVELVVAYGRSVRLPRVGYAVLVHRSRVLVRSDVVGFGHFPRITRPARTIVDVAGLRDVADEALAEITFDLVLGWPRERRRLAETLARMAAARHPGVDRVRALIGDYLETSRRPPHPGLERRLLAVLARSGLPRPVVHPTIETSIGRLEVDLGWPAALLAVEADSARWHSSPAAMRVDRSRDQALAAVGWQCLRVTWEEVRDDPRGLVERLGAVLGQRRAQLGVTPHVG